MTQVCNRVEAAALASDKSVASVLRAAKVSAATFYRWKRREGDPSPRVASRIAAALGMTLSELAPELLSSEAGSDRILPGNESNDSSTTAPSAENIVFVGMDKQILNTFESMLKAAGARLITVPEEAVKAILACCKNVNHCYPGVISGRLSWL